jgi:hypothetical protein
MRMKFSDWWRQVNAALEDDGREVILLRRACAWWAEGLTPAQAVERELDNINSAQEERSYYDT